MSGAPRKTLSDRWAKHPRLERVILFPDTHAPYHSKQNWRIAMDAARGFKPDVVIHLGDLADCYALSSHSKDPERLNNWKAEREACRKLRAEMDDLGATRKVFIEGNHEDRLRRYFEDQAPALAGCFSMDEELRLTDNGWEFTAYKDYARLGKLYLTHDTGQGGKYSTARALETFQHSVCIGHHHQIQYFVQGDATGQHQVGAQFGWLGDPEAVDYMHRIKVKRNWAPGFGIGYHDLTSGYVYLVPVPIVDGTACVEGVVYR